jgi:hypothetical protein
MLQAWKLFLGSWFRFSTLHHFHWKILELFASFHVDLSSKFLLFDVLSKPK